MGRQLQYDKEAKRALRESEETGSNDAKVITGHENQAGLHLKASLNSRASRERHDVCLVALAEHFREEYDGPVSLEVSGKHGESHYQITEEDGELDNEDFRQKVVEEKRHRDF